MLLKDFVTWKLKGAKNVSFFLSACLIILKRVIYSFLVIIRDVDLVSVTAYKSPIPVFL